MDEQQDWKDLAKESQSQFFETLGLRPYDEVYKSNLFLLKKKVGFATCGKPTDLPNNENYYTGYDTEKLSHIKEICEQIIEKSDCNPIKFSCTMLMIHYKNNICDYPVFRIITNGGNIFIDPQCRVYKNWAHFMENNKLPDCEYCYPLNGEYNSDKLIGFAHSPASQLFNKTVEVLDTTGSIASLVAAGVFATGMVVSVGAVAIAAAGTTAACAGVYNFSRNVCTLWDRNKHEQSIGLKDKEARTAWLGVATSASGVATAKAVSHAKKIVEGGKTLSKLGLFGLHTLNASSLLLSGFGFVESLWICVDKYQRGTLTKKDVFDFSCELVFLFNAIASARATSNLVNTMNATITETPAAKKGLTKSQKRNLRRKAAKRRAKGLVEVKSDTLQDNNSGIKNAVQLIILEAIAVYTPRLEEIRYACQSIGHDIRCYRAKEISDLVLFNNVTRTVISLYNKYKNELTEALTKIAKYFDSLNIKSVMHDILELFTNASEEMKHIFCSTVINMEDEFENLINDAEGEVAHLYDEIQIEDISESSDSTLDENLDDNDLNSETQGVLNKCGDVISEANISIKDLEEFEQILEEIKYSVIMSFKEKISNFKRSLEAAKSASGESFDTTVFIQKMGIKGDVGQHMFRSTLEELTTASNIYKIKSKFMKRINTKNCEQSSTCTPVWNHVTEGVEVYNYFGTRRSEAQILSIVSKLIGTPLTKENSNLSQEKDMYMIEILNTENTDEKNVLVFQNQTSENYSSIMIIIVK